MHGERAEIDLSKYGGIPLTLAVAPGNPGWEPLIAADQ